MTIVRKIIFETPMLGRMISKEAKEVGTAISKNLPKPKLTRKPTVAQTTFEEGRGANILAEQNKVLIKTRAKEQSTLSAANQSSKEFGIKTTTLPNPILVKYDKLLNEGEMTLQKAEGLVHEFYIDTGGLFLHCPSNQNRGAFNQTLSAIVEAVHNGTFPKEIKHVVIGHGIGDSLVPHSWQMSGLNLTDAKIIEIFEYVNNAVKNKGEEVLVCCCETAGRSVAGKPGIGHKVDLSLTNTGSFIRGIGYTGPAKIVRVGENKICGHYTVTEGRVLYE